MTDIKGKGVEVQLFHRKEKTVFVFGGGGDASNTFQYIIPICFSQPEE